MRRLMVLLTLAAIAAGAAAHASASTKPPSAVPSVKGGKFEVTCKPGAIPAQAIDPIVAHGQAVSSHQHTFFGRAVTPDSTPESLQAGTGTTCVLAQDGAAYWVPTACNGPCVDAAGQPTKGTDPNDPIANAVKAVKIFAYYFGTPRAAAVEAQYPSSLQMVGGNAAATAPDTQMIGFSCGNGGSHSSPTRSLPYDCTAANGVQGTDGVVAIVKMPYCLEPSGGVEYGARSGGTCPVGDQTLGQVQIHVHYGLNATGYQTGSQLNFASGSAYTFHGDWMNGWDQPKLQALVAGCLDIDRDCGFLTASNPGPA